MMGKTTTAGTSRGYATARSVITTTTTAKTTTPQAVFLNASLGLSGSLPWSPEALMRRSPGRVVLSVAGNRFRVGLSPPLLLPFAQKGCKNDDQYEH